MTNEEEKDFEDHMTESQFRHEVLALINDCRNEIVSKNEKDFDSIDDYGEWLMQCARNLSMYAILLKV